MSGGSWEYVMGVMSKDGLPCSGRDTNSNSGFNGPYCNTTGEKTDGIKFPTDIKYYDVYENRSTSRDYQRRILGDATGEMGPFSSTNYGADTRQVSSWHADESWFVSSNDVWFRRSEAFSDGIGAGIFSFCNNTGTFSNIFSYRIILSV